MRQKPRLAFAPAKFGAEYGRQNAQPLAYIMAPVHAPFISLNVASSKPERLLSYGKITVICVFRLQAERLYGIVPLGKGARAQGPRFSLRLNRPCRRFITNTKDDNHVHEEEEEAQEENQVVSASLVLGLRYRFRISRDLRSLQATEP